MTPKQMGLLAGQLMKTAVQVRRRGNTDYVGMSRPLKHLAFAGLRHKPDVVLDLHGGSVDTDAYLFQDSDRRLVPTQEVGRTLQGKKFLYSSSCNQGPYPATPEMYDKLSGGSLTRVVMTPTGRNGSAYNAFGPPLLLEGARRVLSPLGVSNVGPSRVYEKNNGTWEDRGYWRSPVTVGVATALSALVLSSIYDEIRSRRKRQQMVSP